MAILLKERKINYMQVLKFGGSSVGTPDAIIKVIAIVKQRIQEKPPIVVVSAMSGVTDQLILLAQASLRRLKSTLIASLPRPILALY